MATADRNAVPHLVPVTFAVRDDTVVTAVDHKPKRTTDLRRLRNIEGNPAVCLLADHYDEDWEQLWWVRADGTATVLHSPTDSTEPTALTETSKLSERTDDSTGRAEYVRRLRDKYPQYTGHPPAGPVIHVQVTKWSGWSAR